MCNLRNLLIPLSIWLALAGAPAEALSPAPFTPQPRVRIEPAEMMMDVGDTFTLKVMIDGAVDLGGFQLALVYEPSVVKVERATLGDFLGSTGRSTLPLGPTVDNEAGRLTFGAFTFGSGSGASGTGPLASIMFTARGGGTSSLGLENVQVLDTAGKAQTVAIQGGVVTVRGAAAPTRAPGAAPSPTFTVSPVATATATATVVPPATRTPSPTPRATARPREAPTATPEVTQAPPTATPTRTVTGFVTGTVETTPLTLTAAPTETVTPLPTFTRGITQPPATGTTTPTLPPPVILTPSPSASPMPSPIPRTTVPGPSPRGVPTWGTLGGLLAALIVGLLAALLFRRSKRS